jgi:hypothetical protein
MLEKVEIRTPWSDGLGGPRGEEKSTMHDIAFYGTLWVV